MTSESGRPEIDAPVTREFRPRKTELMGTPLVVEITTEDHTVLTCGPIRAEFREAIAQGGEASSRPPT